MYAKHSVLVMEDGHATPLRPFPIPIQQAVETRKEALHFSIIH